MFAGDEENWKTKSMWLISNMKSSMETMKEGERERVKGKKENVVW